MELSGIEQEIESIEQGAEKEQEGKEQLKDRIEVIQEVVQALEKDVQIQTKTMEIKEYRKEQLREIEENLLKERNQVRKLYESIASFEEQQQEEEEQIAYLETIGLDVEESSQILCERKELLKDLKKRLEEVGKILEMQGLGMEAKAGKSISENLHDPDLFNRYEAGNYTYGKDEDGLFAYGSLMLVSERERDAKSQLKAGGDHRRGSDNPYGKDDGGHLIAALFGGYFGKENLSAQDSNLNRGDYKKMEMEWAQRLNDGYKVFVNIETLGADRPSAYMGYAIFEAPDGTRTFQTYSFNNESRREQEKWEDYDVF